MAKNPKKLAPVNAREAVGEAFGTIMKHNLDGIVQWEPLARSWDDIEGVHQVRVCLRRMRSAFVPFRPAVPRAAAGSWAEEMRWLAGQLGHARDLDVFIAEGLAVLHGRLPLPGEGKVRALAERKRAGAYEQVRAMIDGDRFNRFKQDFDAWLEARAWRDAGSGDKHRKSSDASVVPFARKQLDRQLHKVRSAGSNVDRDSADQMHQLRIECKKLRYTADFFTPVFQGMDEFIGHMKGLQNLLGVMNDVVVMPGLLTELLDGEDDPDVLRYAGGLAGWRTRQYFEIKDTFDARWDEFIHAKNPWWRKHAVIQ